MRAFAKAAAFTAVVMAVFIFIGETLTKISGQSSGPAAAVGVSPEAGEAIFWGKGKCSTCHSVGDQGSAVRCPNLGDAKWPAIGARAADRAGDIARNQGRSLSPSDYLIESMAKPDAYVVEGYKNEMPVIWRPPIALQPDEIKAVALYLMSLGGVPDAASLTIPAYVKPVVEGEAAAWRPYMEGDPEYGREIFFDPEGPGCNKCHRIGDQGGRVGPELTNVGGTRAPEFIMESILDPNKEIASGFEVSEVVTKEMDRIRGIKKAEDDRTVTLALNTGEVEVVNKADVTEMFERKESMMPGNFAELLTVDQLHHLLAYLMSLR